MKNAFLCSALNSCFAYGFSSKIRVCFHSVLLSASENIEEDFGDYILEEKLYFQNPIDDYLYSLSPCLAPSFFPQSLLGILSNKGVFLLLLLLYIQLIFVF